MWPDTAGPQVLVLARRDAKTRTVSLILDTTTANIAMYAITAYAGDREAHVREVEHVGEALPKDPTADVIVKPSPPAKRE
jgi:hypothetical protein